jgi:SAM-dependent methyltransferase
MTRAPEPRAPSGSQIRARAVAVGAPTLEGFARAPRINAWIYGKFAGAVSGDVLEVGSGIGNLSRLILPDARRLMLTDVEPSYLETLRRELGTDRVEVVPWNLEEAPPPVLTAAERRFDSIVAVNVIEHLRDDHAATRTLASLLRPGGRLLVYVPACPWAFGSLDVALGHHRRYTGASLRDLIRGAGLVPSPPRYMNRLGLLGWLMSGRVLKRRTLSTRMIALFEQIVGVARALDLLLAPLPLGLGLVTRATKPLTPQTPPDDPPPPPPP